MKKRVREICIIIVLILTSAFITTGMPHGKTSETIRLPKSLLMSSVPPPMEWNKTYGTGHDWASSLVQTSDGGYALAGSTNSSSGDMNFWLVKTNSTGDMQWNKSYGGTKDDEAYSLVQTSDGGYALAGSTNSSSGDMNFWLVKTNSTGDMQWNKSYGGTKDDEAYSLVQTSDGGYALAGSTNSIGCGGKDFWLVKTNSTGDMQWSKTYGSTSDDWASSLVQTSDGGYALAGRAPFGAGGYDFWLVKTNSTGDMQWNKSYGGTENDEAYSLVQTSDGGYALAGNGFGVSNGYALLVKTNSTGDMLWNQTYAQGIQTDAYSLVQTSDGGYALAGDTGSYAPLGIKFCLVKTNSTGDMEWNQTYEGYDFSFAHSMVQSSDGGYVLAGLGSTDLIDDYLYVIKARSCVLTITPATGGATNPPSGTYSYGAGTVATVSAIPNGNYLFDGWELDDAPAGSANPINVSMNIDHSLQAVFVRTYNLTLSTTIGGTTSPPPGIHIYPNETVINVTALPDTGYLFDYWGFDGAPAGSANPINVSMNIDHSLQAVFVRTYNLTLSTTIGGTTSPPPGIHIYPNETVINVTALPDTDYYLDHWNLDGYNLGAPNSIQVLMSTDHFLAAVFALQSFELILTTTTGGTTDPPPSIYVYRYGENANVVALPEVGYHLDHWQLDGNNVGAANPINVLMSTDHFLVAVFALPYAFELSKTVVGENFSTYVSIRIFNQANETETFNVTVFANETIISLPATVTLTSGAFETMAFTWNTTGFIKGNYSMSASVECIGEPSLSSNVTDSLITISIIGDITGPTGWPDGNVDIRDVSAVARLFGVNSPDPRYNPNSDINDDGTIDIKDVSTVARHYGEPYP